MTKPPVESLKPAPQPAETGPASQATPTPGGLPKDFPKELVPLIDGATVVVSDVEAASDTISLSLVAETDASRKSVLNFYDKTLTDHNFQALESTTAKGAASRTYTRSEGTETVNISVVRSGSTSTITVGAHLSAESVESQ